MSSFFDEASLVFIPSGYKTSKAYSVKPTSGDGDLAFTRSNDTATRVGPDGLIEKVRTNLFTYSEDFSNADWTETNATFSVDTLTADAGTSFKGIVQNETTNGLQNVYFDVAYTNHAFLQIGFGTSASDLGFSNYDIQNKTLGSSSGIVNNSIQDFGTYVRISLSINTTGKTSVFLIFANSASDSRAPSYTGTGSFKLFRSQNESGDIATDYIATTSAAVSVGPVANVPRLDYLDSTCPKLLLEPQRTNSAIYSEQFNNAAWTTQEVTVTANAAIAPDGTQSADNIVPTAITGTHQISSGALVSSSQCAMSVYAKASGYTTFHMLDRASGSNGAAFNLANGTVTNAGSGVGTITSVGNGWYRCTAVATTTGVRFYIPTPASDFTGDGTSGILLWGAQVEAGAYATSYIPTLGSASTRGSDSASKTGISSLIGQTEGTIFVEFDFQKDIDSPYRISLSDGTVSNRIQIGTYGNEVQVFVQTAGVTQVLALGGTITTGTHKMALAYASNDYVAYLDGSAVITDTSASVPACSKIGYEIPDGTGLFEHPIKQQLLFPTRLSNADLAALTA